MIGETGVALNHPGRGHSPLPPQPLANPADATRRPRSRPIERSPSASRVAPELRVPAGGPHLPVVAPPVGPECPRSGPGSAERMTHDAQPQGETRRPWREDPRAPAPAADAPLS